MKKTFKKIPTSRKMLHKERLDTKHPSLQRAWRRMKLTKKELSKIWIKKRTFKLELPKKVYGIYAITPRPPVTGLPSGLRPFPPSKALPVSKLWTYLFLLMLFFSAVFVFVQNSQFRLLFCFKNKQYKSTSATLVKAFTTWTTVSSCTVTWVLLTSLNEDCIQVHSDSYN